MKPITKGKKYGANNNPEKVEIEQTYNNSPAGNKDLGVKHVCIRDLRYVLDYETYRILKRGCIVERLKKENPCAYGCLVDAYNNGYNIDIRVTKNGPYLWVGNSCGEVMLQYLTWEDIDPAKTRRFRF